MTDIFGNQKVRDSIKSDLTRHQICALSGPSYLGKKSFIQTELESSMDSNDVLLTTSNIDGSRESIRFASSRPSFSSKRVIIVDNAHDLSDAAQDAYLKICEEPQEYLSVYFITEDFEFLSSALKSRFSKVYHWSRLTIPEMTEFVNSDSISPDMEALPLCWGRPGLYKTISSDPELKQFYLDAKRILMDGIDRLTSSSLKALSDLKDPERRNALIGICHYLTIELVNMSVDKQKILPLSSLASVLKRYPSANADIFWSKFLLM